MIKELLNSIFNLIFRRKAIAIQPLVMPKEGHWRELQEEELRNIRG